MREIKFRGKRVDNGEWVYGCFAEFVIYLDGDTKPGIQVTNQVPSGFDRMIPAFETELVEVIPETVGQYTGFDDKNGEEIYEGDILSGEFYFKGRGWYDTGEGEFLINDPVIFKDGKFICRGFDLCEIIEDVTNCGHRLDWED